MISKSKVLNELELTLLQYVQIYLASPRWSQVPSQQKDLLRFCYSHSFTFTAIVILDGLTKNHNFKSVYNTWMSFQGSRFYHRQVFELHFINCTKIYSEYNKRIQ